jgi:hypothetical protein
MWHGWGITLLAVTLLPALPVAAMPAGAAKTTSDTTHKEGAQPFQWGESLRYDRARGLVYNSTSTATALWLGLRFQTRYDSNKGSFTTLESLRGPKHSSLDLKRGRFKGGGALFADWFRVYSEYDFSSDTLLDFRATATWDDWLSFRGGQWKSEYNRERVDSSGKQELVERSISNHWFTVDRQLGLSVSPRLARGTGADTTLWFAVLSGQGRGGTFSNGDSLLLARAQWNPAGEVLPFSQADLKRRQKALPSIAVAAISGDSPYTRFSSSGGGSLPGYEKGDYRLKQFLFETAVHYRGLAWQQELHWKEIKDKRNGGTRELWGGYAQLGSFLNEWWSVIPAPLEFVGRVSWVDPDTPGRSDEQREYTVAANWFFGGHRNKLTFDYSLLDFEEGSASASENRWRLQWELSL